MRSKKKQHKKTKGRYVVNLLHKTHVLRSVCSTTRKYSRSPGLSNPSELPSSACEIYYKIHRVEESASKPVRTLEGEWQVPQWKSFSQTFVRRVRYLRHRHENCNGWIFPSGSLRESTLFFSCVLWAYTDDVTPKKNTRGSNKKFRYTLEAGAYKTDYRIVERQKIRAHGKAWRKTWRNCGFESCCGGVGLVLGARATRSSSLAMK